MLIRKCPHTCPLSDSEFEDLHEALAKWERLGEDFQRLERDLVASLGCLMTLMETRAELVKRMCVLIDKLSENGSKVLDINVDPDR